MKLGQMRPRINTPSLGQENFTQNTDLNISLEHQEYTQSCSEGVRLEGQHGKDTAWERNTLSIRGRGKGEAIGKLNFWVSQKRQCHCEIIVCYRSQNQNVKFKEIAPNHIANKWQSYV